MYLKKEEFIKNPLFFWFKIVFLYNLADLIIKSKYENMNSLITKCMKINFI